MTVLAVWAVDASNEGDAAQKIDYTAANRIYASFDLGVPEGGPFPSDIFTVEYAVIVTDGVRDTSGKAVKATSDFESMDAHNAPPWYRARLKEVVDGARSQGLQHSDIICKSSDLS